MKTTKQISGVQEWAKSSYNCVNGCAHNCRYCYAKKMAIRYGRKKLGEWHREELIDRPVKKMTGRIMLPTTHDITPENYQHVEMKILEHLRVGNELLIVSKPHYKCIKYLTASLRRYSSRVLFRLSLGSLDIDTSAYWEPGAPTPGERKACLQLLYESGYKTSVSSEPFLGIDIDKLIEVCNPWITDSHWIGKMNRHFEAKKNLYTQKLTEIYTPEYIQQLYQRHKNNPKIKWKESLKQILGLKLVNKIGDDK